MRSFGETPRPLRQTTNNVIGATLCSRVFDWDFLEPCVEPFFLWLSSIDLQNDLSNRESCSMYRTMKVLDKDGPICYRWIRNCCYARK
jgi:hypothetical protein